MKVKDCMSKNVVTIGPATAVRQIYQFYREHGFGILPVVDKNNKLLGLVTRRTLMELFLPDYVDILDALLFAVNDLGALEQEFEKHPVMELFVAQDLMIRKVITVEEDASLIKAAILMQRFKIHGLPVVKGNNLIGLITLSDICKSLFGQIQYE